ncbi:MAG: hypothetical protein KC636_29275, partial [Myxococcales bacterium]|nr:hypothetical protein [Myxococcales bacterium]
DFSTETLRARIEEVDPVCLSAQQRARFLSEPRDEARARATACEAAQRERRAAVDERPPG